MPSCPQRSPAALARRIAAAAGGSAQNITAFDDLIQGDRYVLYATDGNSTLVDGANLVLTGSTNWNPAATDVFTGFCLDGTKMIQTGKIDNS